VTPFDGISFSRPFQSSSSFREVATPGHRTALEWRLRPFLGNPRWHLSFYSSSFRFGQLPPAPLPLTHSERELFLLIASDFPCWFPFEACRFFQLTTGFPSLIDVLDDSTSSDPIFFFLSGREDLLQSACFRCRRSPFSFSFSLVSF